MARPRQISDEDLLDIARRCVMAHGPAVSTAHIAQEAGLSQAALFKRFQTKENLLMEALAPPLRPAWVDAFGDAPDDRPIQAQLFEIGMLALSFLRELVPRMMMLKSAGIAPHDMMKRFPVPPPILALRKLAAWFGAAQASGRIETGDPSKLALHFMGGLHVRAYLAFIAESPELGGEGDEAYVEHLVQTLFVGIQPREAR